MDALVILIPLLPLLAAVAVGIGQLTGLFTAESRAALAADWVTGALSLSCLMAIALLVGDLLGKNHGYFSVGQWLSSDTLIIRVNFISTGFKVRVAAVFALLLLVISQHVCDLQPHPKNAASQLFILSLFAAALLFLVLAANMVGTLLGWELAAVCIYSLVASRADTADNPVTRIHLSHRFGDAGFIMAISLSYVWLESVNWAQLTTDAPRLSIGEATGLSLFFALAACAKAAQLPFTPWLVRITGIALPLSLLLIHAGVLLLCSLEALFMLSPFARAVLGVVGIATTLYAAIVAKTQTDSHYLLIFACVAQIGLMLLECALGFWQLAGWHLLANAIVSCTQALVVAQPLSRRKPRIVPVGLYQFSLQHGWLEPISDWVVVKPVRGLARDISYFDERIVNRLMGLPILDDRSQHDNNLTWVRGNGVAGQVLVWASTLLHWVEQRFIVRSTDKRTPTLARTLGHALNQCEQLILRPRYLVLFVGITLLVAF